MQDTRRSCDSAVPSMIKAFSFTEAEIFTQLGWSAVFEAFGFTELKAFRPARTGWSFLKLTASLFFYRTSQVPASGAVQPMPPNP